MIRRQKNLFMLLKIRRWLTEISRKFFTKLKKDHLISFHSLNRDNFILTKSFHCNDQDLDSYIKSESIREQEKNFSRVFLGVNQGNELVSFFTLSAMSIDKKDLPRSKRPPYKLAPVVLIGRLAVDKKFQGKGYGEKTLTEVLIKYVKACSVVGSTALVVEAYEESVSFYTKYKFEKIKSEERHGKKITTLYLLTETILKELNQY